MTGDSVPPLRLPRNDLKYARVAREGKKKQRGGSENRLRTTDNTEMKAIESDDTEVSETRETCAAPMTCGKCMTWNDNSETRDSREICSVWQIQEAQHHATMGLAMVDTILTATRGGIVESLHGGHAHTMSAR